MKKNFYISTPLYYVNDKPHLGTAYTNIIADILNRYQKFFGRSSFFITGTDEHGQKCEQAAKELGVSPQSHCDKMSLQFKQTWKHLNIDFDMFFRTSSDHHKKAVSQALQKLYDKGDIYSSNYKGWYCVSEEIFYTEKDLVDGKSPTGKPVTFIEEKAWFFKMSRYQKLMEKHFKEHPQFIEPLERQNEMLGFLKKPLQDLCISRPKTRVSWGVELPFDDTQVVYVWVDALLNYIVGAGYLNEEERFQKTWNEAETLHLIGKDILMTHAIYWSCLLLALEVKLPEKILAHGWLLNKEEEKMSKSKGDKIDPMELTEELGVDALRWFLAKEVPLGKDFALSKDYIIQKVNEQLADNLGNILSRISKLVIKNFDGDISLLIKKEDTQEKSPLKELAEKENPLKELVEKENSLKELVEKENSLKELAEKENPLKELVEKKILEFQNKLNKFELSYALREVSDIFSEINRYLEKTTPWKTVKTDKASAGVVLYNSLEALRMGTLLIYPVMPEKTKKLLSLLGETPDFKNLKWGRLASLDKKLESVPILFPKIQSE